MTIVLQETLRAVFYAPFYAALALGAYAAEESRCASLVHPARLPLPTGFFTDDIIGQRIVDACS